MDKERMQERMEALSDRDRADVLMFSLTRGLQFLTLAPAAILLTEGDKAAKLASDLATEFARVVTSNMDNAITQLEEA